MKNRLALCFLLPLFACLSPALAEREYTKENPLVYEDAWDLWPYVFLDDAGQPTGYNVELLKMLFEELNIPYEIELKSTSQALSDLHSGRSDLMLGMVASFHDHDGMHYGKNVVQLFTHSVAHTRDAQQRVSSVEDLATQQVIVHEGSFSHHLMEDHGWEENALPFGDMDKAIQLVSADGTGQVLWNTMSLKWLIHKYHIDNLVLSPVDMPSGDYRFMSYDEHLLARLDQAYTKLKAENRLLPLEQKWFYPENAPEPGVPFWTWYLVACVGLAALALIAAVIYMRILERRATREGNRRNVRLALILRTCQVKIWTYDVEKRTFTWYGNSPGETRTFTMREFATRYRSDDFAKLMDSIEQLKDRRKNEVRLEMNGTEDANSGEHTYIVNLSVLRSEKGMPSVIIGTKNDITEERESLEKSDELMRRYQSIFNTAMVDMIYYDKDGYIMNMNKRAQSTFKMNIDDVLREHVNLSDILDPNDFKVEDFGGTDHFNSSLFIDYAQERQLESRKRSGQIVYELQLVPVFGNDHKMLGIYGTGREVTEMVDTFRKAKESLRQLRHTMQEVKSHVGNINYVLQQGGVRMVSYSPDSHTLTINHRLHEVQYVLTQQRCLQLTDPDSLRQVMRYFRMMDRRHDAKIECELRTTLRLPGGRNLWLQVEFYPVRDEADGHIIRYNGICRDTTDIKHTERMLQIETKKAQEVEQLKNKFLHNMCYEIRTPLDTVVGLAEMFDKEHDAADEEVFINEIKSNSAYLLNLINDILFLSRLDAHMVEINVGPCDFSATFEGHCHLAWANGRREEVRYYTENPYELLMVNIDDANVGRIIQQVVGNAVEHTTHGSVRARYEYIGGKLIISIDDTGSGIDSDTLKHVFERFNTSANRKKGTGLGLPICKELVTQLGGTIDINSEVGTGTSVWVTIPCEATAIVHKKDI